MIKLLIDAFARTWDLAIYNIIWIAALIPVLYFFFVDEKERKSPYRPRCISIGMFSFGFSGMFASASYSSLLASLVIATVSGIVVSVVVYVSAVFYDCRDKVHD